MALEWMKTRSKSWFGGQRFSELILFRERLAHPSLRNPIVFSSDGSDENRTKPTPQKLRGSLPLAIRTALDRMSQVSAEICLGLTN